MQLGINPPMAIVGFNLARAPAGPLIAAAKAGDARAITAAAYSGASLVEEDEVYSGTMFPGVEAHAQARLGTLTPARTTSGGRPYLPVGSAIAVPCDGLRAASAGGAFLATDLSRLPALTATAVVVCGGGTGGAHEIVIHLAGGG